MKGPAAARVIAGTGLVLLLGLAPAGCAGPEKGRAVFERGGCFSCHRFKGRGGYMGPDLTAVTERRSEEWIARQIRNPKGNNPATRMPSFGHLSRGEVRAVIAYLKS